MKKFVFYFGGIIAMILPLVKGLGGLAAGIALLIGAIFINTNIITPSESSGKIRKFSLNGAVVLFGFGLNINKVIEVGSAGFLQTALSLSIIIFFGFILFRIFKIDQITGELITFGTGICGGSAIAATAPLLKADEREIGISTGVIFLLNTVALFLFSFFAHKLNLTAEQFGTWSALSIHDTSSVVGAAASHSDEALKIATIMKLTRTLWIIPIVLFLAIRNKESKNISFPVFIVFFILASIFATLFNFPEIYKILGVFGKSLLALALYIVGTSLSVGTIKQVGLRSIIFGITLWSISIVSGYLISVYL